VDSSIPPTRHETPRQAVLRVLGQGGAWTTRELSTEAHLSEKEVISVLDALLRGRARVHQEPAACASCGFSFTKRKRAARPSRCPRCRSERIHLPRFTLR